MHRALVTCHCLLLLSCAAAIFSQPVELLTRAIVTAVMTLPLLLGLPGLLAKNRRSFQWLALVLVLYVGIASVEVVASLGSAKFGAATLLFALSELGLLVAMLRRRPNAAFPE